MKITIVGTGYVGLVSGTCFAEIGHHVTCIDIDQRKVDLLSSGQSPIYEQGLTELLQRNIKNNRLKFESSYDSISEAQAVFIAVGTPSNDDGTANLSYVYSAIDSAVSLMNENSILVLKSTVPIGTANKVKKHINSKRPIVNNPEFLREGSAVNDFLYPDRIIIGYEEERAGQLIEELYKPLVRQGNPIFHMSNISAEMTKYAANTFLASKISFINEVARICDLTGADIEEVKKGIASDKRIGKEFLYPGPGYGGSCFPKDVKALETTAKEINADLKLIFSIDKSNDDQKSYVVSKIMNHFNGDLNDKTIALWGVAFKANTDDIRESSAIAITKEVLEKGGSIRFYDPCASKNFETHFSNHPSISKVDGMYDTLKGSDALVVVTEWREFQSPNFEKIKENLNQALIFDFRNLFNTKEVLDNGFRYYSVGKRTQ